MWLPVFFSALEKKSTKYSNHKSAFGSQRLRESWLVGWCDKSRFSMIGFQSLIGFNPDPECAPRSFINHARHNVTSVISAPRSEGQLNNLVNNCLWYKQQMWVRVCPPVALYNNRWWEFNMHEWIVHHSLKGQIMASTKNAIVCNERCGVKLHIYETLMYIFLSFLQWSPGPSK